MKIIIESLILVFGPFFEKTDSDHNYCDIPSNRIIQALVFVTFFWKYWTYILWNYESISLLICFKLIVSFFTTFTYSFTVSSDLIALFISSMRVRFCCTRELAITFKSSILLQWSSVTFFSYCLFSSFILSCWTSFLFCISNCYSFWIDVIRLSNLVRRWDNYE